MRKRTLSREFALQMLYKVDITRDSPDTAIADFWQDHLEENIEDEVRNFATEIVKGTIDNLSVIDQKISQYATNWEIERMAVIDRNIMRMGSYELLYRSDIPPKVSINESVELAKRYSGQEAGKFVNAILDKIRMEIDKK